ncbi:hypothetical protein FHX81_3925 [Saccharothrix saharensis]|uniref:Lipoprotein n=1 Tax=Saccharothrix saharensis TaxID=571190 RepID=A0A543JFC8_9PSEU|nr:hypothetical protein [Saccharothrix saharensis]TQM81558.1 hypothetical protein FHX81_3925 [Saccharothrix saharensis]
MTRSKLLLAVCSLLAVAACTGGPVAPTGPVDPAATAAEEPPVAEVPDVAGARQYDLPLDRYQMTHEEGLAIASATQTLTAECLRRFGFTPKTFPVPRDPAATDRRYGINVHEEVDRFGYHPPPEQLVEKPDYRPSEAEHRVALGQDVDHHNGQDVPEGGCMGEARRKLYGDDGVPSGQDPASAAALDAESGARYRQDSRVLEVYRKWSGCMEESGYDYADPWAANNDRRWTESDSTTTTEIAVAKADLACRDEHRVVSVSLAVEAAYQTRMVEQNSVRLDAERDRNQTAVRRAVELVGR